MPFSSCACSTSRSTRSPPPPRLRRANGSCPPGRQTLSRKPNSNGCSARWWRWGSSMKPPAFSLGCNPAAQSRSGGRRCFPPAWTWRCIKGGCRNCWQPWPRNPPPCGLSRTTCSTVAGCPTCPRCPLMPPLPTSPGASSWNAATRRFRPSPKPQSGAAGARPLNAGNCSAKSQGITAARNNASNSCSPG